MQQHKVLLDTFNERFEKFVAGDFPEIEQVHRQLFQAKGKQLRPMLVLLTHRLFRDDVSEQAYLAASLVEIVHMASLIHDDVVDMADMRRGNASLRSMFGNKTAVLTGDYMLANAFLKAYDGDDTQLLLFLVEVIRQMSAGELIQLKYAANPDSNKETYYRIIERKTAVLFGCCCQCGAHTAKACAEEVELAKEIGRNAGMVFQIKDDLLDLDMEKDSGKQYGNDLLEGKLTLPALYYLKHCSGQEKTAFFNSLQQLIEQHNNPDRTARQETSSQNPELERLILLIKASGGEEYARQQAAVFAQKAWESYRRIGRGLPAFEELLDQICHI